MNNDIEQRLSSARPVYAETIIEVSHPNRVRGGVIRRAIEKAAEKRKLKKELEWWG